MGGFIVDGPQILSILLKYTIMLMSLLKLKPSIV